MLLALVSVLLVNPVMAQDSVTSAQLDSHVACVAAFDEVVWHVNASSEPINLC
ncbi:hypothetical protein [Brevundimonas faecalis]|uniref:Uncharacterized protein n=1 Tax=Brevundimonas faecalis TaxID=947378 RepID=A0ABV2RAC2_9CAUL